MSTLHILPCLDSAEMAASRRQELDIPREVAAALGRSAVNAARDGRYVTKTSQEVVWRDAVQAACAAKRSIPRDAPLLPFERGAFTATRVQVTNETTLGASRRLVDRGLRPLALNFANGVLPGGGFLGGARAQQRCSVDPRLSIRPSSMIRCIGSTANAHNQTPRTGQSTRLTCLSFARMTGRSCPIRGS